MTSKSLFKSVNLSNKLVSGILFDILRVTCQHTMQELLIKNSNHQQSTPIKLMIFYQHGIILLLLSLPPKQFHAEVILILRFYPPCLFLRHITTYIWSRQKLPLHACMKLWPWKCHTWSMLRSLSLSYLFTWNTDMSFSPINVLTTQGVACKSVPQTMVFNSNKQRSRGNNPLSGWKDYKISLQHYWVCTPNLLEQ